MARRHPAQRLAATGCGRLAGPRLRCIRSRSVRLANHRAGSPTLRVILFLPTSAPWPPPRPQPRAHLDPEVAGLCEVAQPLLHEPPAVPGRRVGGVGHHRRVKQPPRQLRVALLHRQVGPGGPDVGVGAACRRMLAHTFFRSYVRLGTAPGQAHCSTGQSVQEAHCWPASAHGPAGAAPPLHCTCGCCALLVQPRRLLVAPLHRQNLAEAHVRPAVGRVQLAAPACQGQPLWVHCDACGCSRGSGSKAVYAYLVRVTCRPASRPRVLRGTHLYL